jgi:hypothetical protein
LPLEKTFQQQKIIFMHNTLKFASAALLLGIVMLMVAPASAMAKNDASQKAADRWSEKKANAWYAQQPWMAGCDYIPATAVNQIEMWQAATFDAPQIDKELTWAQDLGFKTLRVFLSSVVWQNDAAGLKQRIDTFLKLCDKHGIRPMFVFFDDCWAPESHYGQQPAPRPGVHNSGWVQDPSVSLRADTARLFPMLHKYVKDIISTFGKDKRVLLWDLYNEPGNSGHNLETLPLLKHVFKWARQCNPTQPLTAGIWYMDCPALNAYQLNHSDVISYHNYSDEANHATEISYLKMLNRPLVCTEYMARRQNSLFQNIMPMLKKEKVVAINWGFVAGKTNTIFAWGTPLPDVKEPPIWFHDIYRQDGTPFDPKEVELIKSLTK